MNTTNVKLSKRAKAYLSAHNLDPNTVFELGINAYAREHSLGDPSDGVSASTQRGDATINYSPTFIQKGNNTYTILSNIKFALRVVFAPRTESEMVAHRVLQWVFLAGMGLATAMFIGAITLS